MPIGCHHPWCSNSIQVACDRLTGNGPDADAGWQTERSARLLTGEYETLAQCFHIRIHYTAVICRICNRPGCKMPPKALQAVPDCAFASRLKGLCREVNVSERKPSVASLRGRPSPLRSGVLRPAARGRIRLKPSRGLYIGRWTNFLVPDPPQRPLAERGSGLGGQSRQPCPALG